MTKRQEIEKSIDKQAEIAHLVASDYKPMLGFKLTNIDDKTINSISVASLNEAEDLAISFVSTFEKGNVFTNDLFSEDKDLFLRVKLILPE